MQRQFNIIISWYKHLILFHYDFFWSFYSGMNKWKTNSEKKLQRRLQISALFTKTDVYLHQQGKNVYKIRICKYLNLDYLHITCFIKYVCLNSINITKNIALEMIAKTTMLSILTVREDARLLPEKLHSKINFTAILYWAVVLSPYAAWFLLTEDQVDPSVLKLL